MSNDFVCVYDNPATMRRECYSNGHITYSYSISFLYQVGRKPPIFFGANIGEWATGQLIGDKEAMIKQAIEKR